MDFSLTDEQQQLRDLIARWALAEYGRDKRRAVIDGSRDWRVNWQSFADFGLMAAPLPTAHGGLDGGPEELLVIMEEFGKALVVEPYLPTMIAARLLARAGACALLPAVAEGKAVLAFAHAEAGGHDLAAVDMSALPDGAGGYRLSGTKIAVTGAPRASHLLVSARGPEGLSLYLVPTDTAGITLAPYLGIDGQAGADVTFAEVPVGGGALVGKPGPAAAAIELALDEGAALLCAEASGMLGRMVELTVDYARERRQFGVAIGSFQALQHRMADMFMAAQQASSMALLATIRLSSDDPVERSRDISAAKVYIGKAARQIRHSAIQIHGGMGMTMEMDISDYSRRTTVLEAQFGGVEWHLRRYMALTAPAQYAA